MKYELMVMLKPLLPEDIRGGVQKRVETLLAKFKGKVVSTDVWGKKHLAYPINGHDEGYYIVYSIELDEANVEVFTKELRLVSDILRFLITKN